MPTARLDGPAPEFRLLLSHHEDLVAERTRIINRSRDRRSLPGGIRPHNASSVARFGSAGRALIRSPPLTQEIAVAVDDFPLVVLASVEVGDAQRVVLDRARAERDVLVPHRVGELPAGAGPRPGRSRRTGTGRSASPPCGTSAAPRRSRTYRRRPPNRVTGSRVDQTLAERRGHAVPCRLGFDLTRQRVVRKSARSVTAASNGRSGPRRSAR